MVNGEEDETIWVYKTSIHFGDFLFRLLLWRFRLRGGLLDGSSSVHVRTEFTVVANEVCNLAEGLVCDWVFDRHGARRHGIS